MTPIGCGQISDSASCEVP